VSGCQSALPGSRQVRHSCDYSARRASAGSTREARSARRHHLEQQRLDVARYGKCRGRAGHRAESQDEEAHRGGPFARCATDRRRARAARRSPASPAGPRSITARVFQGQPSSSRAREHTEPGQETPSPCSSGSERTSERRPRGPYPGRTRDRPNRRSRYGSGRGPGFAAVCRLKPSVKVLQRLISDDTPEYSTPPAAEHLFRIERP
jgi:hypothetical protein